jgi:hypothetical protein
MDLPYVELQPHTKDDTNYAATFTTTTMPSHNYNTLPQRTLL